MVLVVALGLLGLPVGSFLTVVAHRVPLKESVIRPRSRCPSCMQTIWPIDNVPVASYLLRRGRCRFCQAPIPLRYPLVELATGGLFAAVTARVPGTFTLAAYLVLTGALIVLCLVDLETMRLPTPILLVAASMGGMLLVLASAGSGSWSAFLRAVVAAGVCGGAFLLVWLAAPRAIGLGDVRLAALCGGFLGWLGYRVTLVGFLSSFLLAGAVALVLLGLGRVRRRSRLPFGPFLSAGALIGVLWGSELARIWLGA
jgi:leader peptidase (prepilin peptidase)/N-methyltransferase